LAFFYSPSNKRRKNSKRVKFGDGTKKQYDFAN